LSEAQWKRGERSVAKLLGGHRNPHDGSAAVDVETPLLAVEVKSRKELPAWIKAALSSARAKARRGQVGIVVLREHGARDAWVVMSLHDFARRILPKGGG